MLNGFSQRHIQDVIIAVYSCILSALTLSAPPHSTVQGIQIFGHKCLLLLHGSTSDDLNCSVSGPLPYPYNVLRTTCSDHAPRSPPSLIFHDAIGEQSNSQYAISIGGIFSPVTGVEARTKFIIVLSFFFRIVKCC